MFLFLFLDLIAFEPIYIKIYEYEFSNNSDSGNESIIILKYAFYFSIFFRSKIFLEMKWYFNGTEMDEDIWNRYKRNNNNVDENYLSQLFNYEISVKNLGYYTLEVVNKEYNLRKNISFILMKTEWFVPDMLGSNITSTYDFEVKKVTDFEQINDHAIKYDPNKAKFEAYTGYNVEPLRNIPQDEDFDIRSSVRITSEKCTYDHICKFNELVNIKCLAAAYELQSLLMFSIPCSDTQNCNDILVNNVTTDYIKNYRNSYPNKTSFFESFFEHRGFLTGNESQQTNSSQFNLFLCVANISGAEEIENAVIIPSNYSENVRSKLCLINLSNRSEVLEGDSFRIEFSFLNQVFNKSTIKIIPPNKNCAIVFKMPTETEHECSISLFIQNATKVCEGIYRFRVESKKYDFFKNQNGEYLKEKNEISIKVHPPRLPVFENVSLYNTHLTSIKVSEISKENYKVTCDSSLNLILSCKTRGELKPITEWYKNNNELKPTGSIKIDAENQTLMFTNIQSNDSGEYTCIVKNAINQIERNFSVKIFKPIKHMEVIISSIVILLVFVICIYLIIRNNYLKVRLLFLNIQFYDKQKVFLFKKKNRDFQKYNEEYWELERNEFKIITGSNFSYTCRTHFFSSTVFDLCKNQKNELILNN